MKYISEHVAEALYNELIDECHPTIKIFGVEYLPSQALKKLDPIAFVCGFNDWLDSQHLTTDADESEADAVNFNGKTYTLTTRAEPSSRLLPYPKNYHEVQMGDEYDFELVAKAVDENGNACQVRWIFSETKGEESESYDGFDYDNVYDVIVL